MLSRYLQDKQARECFGIAPVKEKPEVYKIPKRSDKMKKEMAKLIPAYKEFLARPENKFCAIKMKGCTGEATVVHHQSGRIGAKLHDQEDWLPCCPTCNLTAEIESLEARSNGIKKSKYLT